MTPSLDLWACADSAWRATPDMALRVVTCGGMVALAAWAEGRRPFPGRRTFSALCAALALWLALGVVEHSSSDPVCKSSVGLLGWTAMLFQPLLWTLFLYQYLHSRNDEPRWRLRLVFATPSALMLMLALSNGAHGLWYGPGTALTPPIAGLPRMRYDYGPLFYAAVAMGYAWMALAYLLALRGWRHTPPGRRGQWVAFLVLMTVPLGANLSYVLFGWRLYGADPTSLAFSFVLVGFATMAARSQLFTLVPVATRLLFAHLPDPVLVVDATGRVLEANEAATALAGGSPTLGAPLADWPTFGAELQSRLQPGRSEKLLSLGRPQRQFEVQVRALGGADPPVGLLVQLHDVTARESERTHAVQRLAEREAEQATLRDQALQDPLTGLWNRRALEQWFSRHGPGEAALTLALLDLDHFKRINDKHGHAAGDAVLREFAGELRQAVRAGDAVFRVGGEEFALVLPGLDAALAAQRLATFHVRLGAQPLGGLATVVGFSAGVADTATWGSDLAALLRAADAALYRAKAEGRGCTRLAG